MSAKARRLLLPAFALWVIRAVEPQRQALAASIG
jgi:hypothetical protein